MSAPAIERLRNIKTLPQLVAYLRDELDWPIDTSDIASMYFEYDAAELGLDEKSAVKIKEIKQIRPLTSNQPWGIFFVNFEKKRLPVMVMRRILRSLVFKKRNTAGKSERQAWHASDLLFISAYGEERDRAVTFAHFVENPGTNLAELRVLGWDDDDTPLHLEYVAQTLNDKLSWDDRVAADPNAWRERWSEAFLLRYRHVVRTSAELALALAQLAKRLRRRIQTILRSEDGFGQIRKLQKAFRDGLIHDLDDDRFADMFAQTVTYGLFSVACRRTFGRDGTAFVKEDAMHYFTSPFLKEMLGIFLGLKSRKGSIDFDELGVSDITDLLTSPDTHLEAVLRDFNNKTRSEDPVIYFYEHFLDAYDRADRKRRGIYYTPKPVVSYIVRSVHELLQSEFKLEFGLADTTTWGEMLDRHPELKLPPLSDVPGERKTISTDEFFVQILDPATGTATFLVEVIEVIYHHLRTKWENGGLKAMPALPLTSFPRQPTDFSDYWNQYVGSALLPRLHGYELMMAPYAIADMRIGLKLLETGYRFGAHDRARIYLTNALEPWVKQLPLIGFDALAHEAAAVNEIKRHKRFTVVIGNPPYSINSANASINPDGELSAIGKLVEEYKLLRGESINERNPKALQDDYVKFIRLAEGQICNSGSGVIGLITNHGYLENPTFRGMRSHLIDRFNLLQFLDLHGNAKKKEVAPDGRPDENVFDILQGVAIMLAVKVTHKSLRVLHSDAWGTRQRKYNLLQGSESKRAEWAGITPCLPLLLFVPQDISLQAEYEKGWAITDVFMVHGHGVKTHRDDFAIAFNKETMTTRIRDLRDKGQKTAAIRARYFGESTGRDYPAGDNAHWKLENVRRKLEQEPKWRDDIIPIHYRPFDWRYCFHNCAIMDRPRNQIMCHMRNGRNLALITTRQTKPAQFRHFLVTRNVSEVIILSPQTSTDGYVFPAYRFNTQEDNLLTRASPNNGDVCDSNLMPAFAAYVGKILNATLVDNDINIDARRVTSEDALFYFYALLHSESFRQRYSEFLKRDFPRLPLTGNLDLFRALARLGSELTALHLLESPKLDEPRTEFIGGRNPEVEKVSYSKNTVCIDKAQTVGFRGVPDEVWNFHVGGYQVCAKWLKDRKGRTLSKADIARYHKIVVALSETIRIMSEIDKVIEKYGGWPGAFERAE